MFKSIQTIKCGVVSCLASLLLCVQVSAPVMAGPPANFGPTTSSRALPAEAKRVHVILLVYGPQGEFGDACRKDVAAVRATLTAGFEAKSDRLVFHDLTGTNPNTGSDYTADEAREYLRNLNLGDNESVVVFHSGHGSIGDSREPEMSQRFQLTSGTCLVRGEIMTILQAKRPRALIVLTDCCSAFANKDILEALISMAGAGRPAGPAGAARPVAPGLDAAMVQNLFLRSAGVISITAADDGTNGVIGWNGANPANAGSSFTVALLRLFYRSEGRPISSWADLYPVLREETFQASSHNRPHRARAFRIDEVRAVTGPMAP